MGGEGKGWSGTCGGRGPEGRACGGGRPGRRHSCRGARSSGAGAARASRSPIVARRRRKGEEVLEGGRWKCRRRRRSCECAWMAWALFGSAAYEARGAGLEPHGSWNPAVPVWWRLLSVRSGLEPNRTRLYKKKVYGVTAPASVGACDPASGILDWEWSFGLGTRRIEDDGSKG
jgi:hypothetical protein